jgi:hypothetical protein
VAPLAATPVSGASMGTMCLGVTVINAIVAPAMTDNISAVEETADRRGL